MSISSTAIIDKCCYDVVVGYSSELGCCSGITLPSLWLRLERHVPMFDLKLDNYSKAFIWKTVIACHEELQFYKLTCPRPCISFEDQQVSW